MGLLHLRDINNAGLRKFSTDDSSLWVNVMRMKYGCNVDGFPFISTKRPGSNLWRGLCSVWDHFRSCINWKLGRGDSFRFLEDNWLGGLGPIVKMADVSIPNDFMQRLFL